MQAGGRGHLALPCRGQAGFGKQGFQQFVLHGTQSLFCVSMQPAAPGAAAFQLVAHRVHHPQQFRAAQMVFEQVFVCAELHRRFHIGKIFVAAQHHHTPVKAGRLGALD